MATFLGFSVSAGVLAASLLAGPMAHAAQECKAATALSQAVGTSVAIAADGTCLRAFSWVPQQAPVRAVVVITHGIRDYALRYDQFARQLNAQGYAVFAQDLRGHAYSGGERQRFDSMPQLVADMALVVEQARKQFPAAPLFLYGHSLGGLITTEYVIANPGQARGLVLSGAALQRPASVSGASVAAARAIAAIAPGFNAVAVDDHEFSRDPAVMAALGADPLISHDKLPAITAVVSIDGMLDVQKRASTLKTPMLVMYGTADKVNPIAGSHALMTASGSADKTMKPFTGLYHDMLHEPERDQVAATVIDWINNRL